MSYVSGVSTDIAGNLYVADNTRIRKVSYCAAAIPLTISGVNNICSGNSTTFTANGATTYTWSGNAGGATTNTISVSPISDTVYTVLGISGSCVGIDSIQVNINPIPTISFMLQKDTSAAYTWDAYPNYSSNVSSAVWYWGDNTSTAGLYSSHTFATAGQYNICLTVFSACGDSANYCQNDSIYRLAHNNSTSSNMIYVNVVQNTSGINQVSVNKEQITVYPNPAENSLQVTVAGNSKIQAVNLYDLLCNEIPTPKSSGEGNSITIDVSNLQNGVYFIQVKTSEGVLSKKVVIQH